MPGLSLDTSNAFGSQPVTMPTSGNKVLADIASQDSSRLPSPQPTHMSSHNSNGHRKLRSATVGYVAPEFAGKIEQMKTGKLSPDMIQSNAADIDPSSPQYHSR